MGIFDRILKRGKTEELQKPAETLKIQRSTPQQAEPVISNAPKATSATPSTTTVKKDVAPKAAAPKTADTRVLIRPFLTEKTFRLATEHQVVFEVQKFANKVQVAQAIHALYGFVPTDVQIIMQKGKPTRFGRIRGSRKAWKKAIITLKPGDRIDLFTPTS